MPDVVYEACFDYSLNSPNVNAPPISQPEQSRLRGLGNIDASSEANPIQHFVGDAGPLAPNAQTGC